MARKLIKKYLPDPDKIKNNRFLAIFGSWLHDHQYWYLNRGSVSRAFAIGLFCAFIPVPFQMVIAAALAFVWRANLPISVGLVWITNPITIPPIFLFAYQVGAWALSWPPSEFTFSLSMEWLGNELQHIWQPFLLGCLICGLVAGALGYAFISLLWRYHVVKNWRARKARWAARLHLSSKSTDDDAEHSFQSNNEPPTNSAKKPSDD